MEHGSRAFCLTHVSASLFVYLNRDKDLTSWDEGDVGVVPRQALGRGFLWKGAEGQTCHKLVPSPDAGVASCLETEHTGRVIEQILEQSAFNKI